MAEAGVDITAQGSKHVDALAGIDFDLVVTLCDGAGESCPTFRAGARMMHVPFDDPPALARSAMTDEEAMPHYRRVRDEIGAFVKALPYSMNGATAMTPRSSCEESRCSAAPPEAHALRDQVRAGYATIAKGACCGGAGGGCCGPASISPELLAKAIGYSREELASMPEGANMGLSCGNPTAIASLRPGEVVLDLGAGGGFDCFVAGPKVGAAGRAIGVDMTPEMLAKARRGVATYREQTGLDNVEFRLGEIESLPVADASIDVVISNCVLNLSPDKPRVWREIARVLKRGGRVAVSDIALLRPLPDVVKGDLEALVGCVAGAVLVEDTRAMALGAGLRDLVLTPKRHYIDAMVNWQDPLYRRIIEHLPAGLSASDFITSLDVTGTKC